MLSFIRRNFYYIKFLIEKCDFSTFYLVSKNTKGHFTQKIKLLGFHEPYVECPMDTPIKKYQCGQNLIFDPSRAELEPRPLQILNSQNSFLNPYMRQSWSHINDEIFQLEHNFSIKPILVCRKLNSNENTIEYRLEATLNSNVYLIDYIQIDTPKNKMWLLLILAKATQTIAPSLNIIVNKTICLYGTGVVSAQTVGGASRSSRSTTQQQNYLVKQ